MDFPLNISVHNNVGFVGQKNTTDVVLDADKIPQDKLTSWTNEYGYFGRTAFDTPKMIDGMNTQGFSVAMLYLPGTQYPVFDAQDTRPVLGIYDLGSYLLAMAPNVPQALDLVKKHQIVQAAIETESGIYLKDIPAHLVLRDKSGASAVIEFVNGKPVIYEQASNVMTNQPTYDWQLKHAALYDSLKSGGPLPNPTFAKMVLDYDAILKESGGESPFLLGLPGDYTAASRFVKATVLLNNLPEPHSTQEAAFHAQSVLNSVIVPPTSDSFTIWTMIKDLDNQLVYIKELGYFQGGKRFYPMSITNGYTQFDLKAIDFNAVPVEYRDATIQPTPADQVKKILSATEVPGF